jgi:hypothetical protein
MLSTGATRLSPARPSFTFADDRLSAGKWSSLGVPPQPYHSIRVSDFEVVDLGAEVPLTINCVHAP